MSEILFLQELKKHKEEFGLGPDNINSGGDFLKRTFLDCFDSRGHVMDPKGILYCLRTRGSSLTLRNTNLDSFRQELMWLERQDYYYEYMLVTPSVFPSAYFQWWIGNLSKSPGYFVINPSITSTFDLTCYLIVKLIQGMRHRTGPVLNILAGDTDGMVDNSSSFERFLSPSDIKVICDILNRNPLEWDGINFDSKKINTFKYDSRGIAYFISNALHNEEVRKFLVAFSKNWAPEGKLFGDTFFGSFSSTLNSVSNIIARSVRLKIFSKEDWEFSPDDI